MICVGDEDRDIPGGADLDDRQMAVAVDLSANPDAVSDVPRMSVISRDDDEYARLESVVTLSPER
jgi:hypothetical protein